MLKKATRAVKNRIIAGMFLIIPLAITYALVYLTSVKLLELFDPILRNFHLPKFVATIVALMIVLVILYFIGFLSSIIFIKRLINVGERILTRIPVVKLFYVTSRQVLDAIAIMKQQSKNKVVVVEYPRKGIKCLAFLTGEMKMNGEDGYLVNIFLPSTPNPTTGFFLMLSPDQVWDANITLEEATKMLISGGIIIPENFKLTPYSSMKNAHFEGKDFN